MSETPPAAGPDQAAAWEKAYLDQVPAAAVGRLFRGIIHNLNGVLQVSSLQGDMSHLLLGRAEELVRQLRVAAPDQAALLLAELESLLAAQRDSVTQLQEKTRQGAEILRRVLSLPPLSSGSAPPWTLNNVLECEIEFLCADPFFKHKVEKKLELAAHPPPLGGDPVTAHQIVHLLLANALEALRDLEGARIEVVITPTEAGLELLLNDNGPGIAAVERELIFEPFLTTRPNRGGLGLYLARKLARDEGGELTCPETAGGARFKLRLPAA